MSLPIAFAAIVIVLILGRLVVELWLAALNRRNVLAHAGEMPAVFRGILEEPVYQKSIRYTLAKERFGKLETVFNAVLTLVVLFCGVLPWSFHIIPAGLGSSVWILAAWLFGVGLVLSLLSLPLAWFFQFRIEQKFGFNTTTPKLWWTDQFKGLLLSFCLGYPLLALLLKLVTWTGNWWWLWGWGAVVAFQLLLSVLAPIFILPLFNRFTPLPEGSLRERLFALAARTRFQVQNMQLMDGSKRSRHSNAFFTGLGRFRKIVLFDTLVEQLSEPELEAVVAHEIGHFKKKHVPKMLAASSLGLLAGFYLLAVLSRQEWFYRAFGFEPGNVAPAFLLFGLLAGTVVFWLSPLLHGWSRRNEYQADAFAARTVEKSEPLVGALRKLNQNNLSNPVPHPLYSRFYYSHPTLLEREQALGKLDSGAGGLNIG